MLGEYEKAVFAQQKASEKAKTARKKVIQFLEVVEATNASVD